MVSECFGTRSAVNSNCKESLETKWELTLKEQQNEAHSLCHHAIHKLIPMAGAYQQSMLNAVSQASTIYAPEEAEAISHEGNKRIEEVSSHISAILFNARKMRDANRDVKNMEDSHVKAIMYHNSVMPYIETLRFHTNRLNELICMA